MNAKFAINYLLKLSLAASFMLLFTACSNSKTDSSLLPYQGVWGGEIHTDALGTFDMTLDIYIDDSKQAILFSSEVFDYYYLSLNWKVEDDSLVIEMNDEANRAIINLKKEDEKTLVGTHTQYGAENTLKLFKKSKKAKYGTFHRKYQEYSYEERLGQLKEYSEYADEDITIPFTYELGQRKRYQELIDQYDLDTLTEGHKDVDLMVVLLNWVCDNFKHNGNSGLPIKRNAYALIDYYNEEDNNLNCRGLSILLAELLRLYEIPAKHITCMPKEPEFSDCHVVVHAYSEDLEQWIMLDPTYRLYLQNEDGNYVNLPMLREILLKDEELTPNEDAGWNGNPFYIEDYREYMTKNTFRFQCCTDYTFGSEDGGIWNVTNMLIPVGYNEDRAKRTTTDDQAFWAKP